MIYRQYVKDVKRYSGSLSLSNDSQTRDTLDWLLSQHITCAKDSDQYKNLLDFVNGLPGGFVGMPFFQYDGEVSVDSGTNVKANLKFCLYSTSKPFLNGAGVEFAECLSSEQNLKTFIIKIILQLFIRMAGLRRILQM